MNNQIKKIFFITLLVLFLITAFLIVSYSLGWRFDWKTKKITQPGLFYFKVLPKGSQIYLNGKLKKKTDFFFGSALIDNLLPEKYNVEIKKEGFYSWGKTLEIKKRQATEAKNIVLIPENPKFTDISKNTENIFFAPDNKKIILEEKTVNNDPNGSNQISGNNWTLKLFEIDKNLKSQLIEEKDILSSIQKLDSKKIKKVQLIDLKFSPDSKTVLLKLGVEEGLKYYLLEINKTLPALTPLDFLGPGIEKVYFNPKDPAKLFILSLPNIEIKNNEEPKTLSEVDLSGKGILTPVLKDIITCSIYNDNIYCLDNSGFIFKINFSFKNKEKLNITPLSLRKETAYEITVSGSQIVLKEGDALYLLLENKSFQKISDFVKGFKFSSDLKKLAYFNDHEIWILFLEKKYDQPQKKNGEQLFLTRFSEKIDEIFWYTSHYLIFNAGNKIKVAEIDDRDKINIVELANFENPQISWNQRNNKLYVLSEKNLFSSEKLLP